MTTKLRIIDGVEQEACKSGIRRLRLVRLHTAGDRQRAAVSSAGVGSHNTVPEGDSGFKCPTCRTANGSIRRSSDPRGTVLITLLVRQQQQRRRLAVRCAQQVGLHIRYKDTVLIVLPVWSLNSDIWVSGSSPHSWISDDSQHRRSGLTSVSQTFAEETMRQRLLSASGIEAHSER